MIVLGIDTSCDDTSVAVLDENKILANLVSSHLIHTEFGGVVPEYASRAHSQLLYPLTMQALNTAGISFNDLDLIAATAGPGLMGALLCGLSFAKGLVCGSGKKFRAVNHMEGHIYSSVLANPQLEPPFLILLVSGGHTELMHVKNWFQYSELGATLDDACGEAIDKVGKLLGLGYPAGPAIEKLALKSNSPIALPRPNPKGLDFSYSGLKTAARNYILANPDTPIEDIAAGLQEAAFAHLIDRVTRAVDKLSVTKLALAGGVAVNKHLREKLRIAGRKKGFEVYAPSSGLCTDNAAMIAAAGLARYRRQGQSKLDVSAFDRTSLEEESL